MAKIVLIGAGSHIFARNLITDIFSFPELRNSTITLMDIAKEPLELSPLSPEKMVKQQGFEAKIESTTGPPESADRRGLRFCHDPGRGKNRMQIDGDIIKSYRCRRLARYCWTRRSFLRVGAMCR